MDFFHDYHPQTLGPLPIISLVCPELESSKICLRTHLFLPLGQKEIRSYLVANLLKNNKSAGRDLKKEIIWENGIMAIYIRGPLVESKKTKKKVPSP